MKLILMLLWVGPWQGGPAIIQGFDSLTSCKAAIPSISSEYAKLAGYDRTPTINCIEVNR